MSPAEIGLGLRGLRRLIEFRPDFTAYFDLSPAGARRSFWLAIPIFPIYMALQFQAARMIGEGSGYGRSFGALIVFYPVLWVAFPMVLLALARVADRQSQVYGAITIYNWLNVIAIGSQLIVIVGTWIGVGDGTMNFLDLATYALYYIVECFAFRHVLKINIGSAIAVTIADFALSQILFALLSTVMYGRLI